MTFTTRRTITIDMPSDLANDVLNEKFKRHCICSGMSRTFSIGIILIHKTISRLSQARCLSAYTHTLSCIPQPQQAPH